jgi:SWIM zinc finger
MSDLVARWSIEQVVALAPTPARYAAAEALAVPSRWVALGADDRAVWGRCRGSGREPYDTMVDHAHVAWRCDCPSRSQPCKHALALLAMWVRGHAPVAPAPPVVARWVDAHARARPATATGPSAPAGGAAGAAAEDGDRDGDEAADGPTPVDLTRGRDERIARLEQGLIELDRWLDDRVRTGLSDPSLGRYDTWDDLAARLVDARAGALANRVRRLAGVVGSRPDWHEVVLAELGILHLLAQAGRRVRELPAPLADAVGTACGWLVRQADVRAGVPDTDTWVVAGRSDTREDRIEVRRVWLRGRRSGRWAMVLSFAAYRQSLDTSLVVGAELTADLHRFPGPSVRALVGIVHDAAGVAPPPPAVTIAEACDEIGAWFAAEPWLDRVPVTVRATPTVARGRWVLTDATGSLALTDRAADHAADHVTDRTAGHGFDHGGRAALLAASAGAPVDVTVEWTLDGAVPITVHLPDRAIDIGPRADASFVSAA